MTSGTDWTCDANEALRLSLVRAKDDKTSLTSREAYEGFHPTFTYPIYGEDEKIYGYNDLVIDLKFASGSLATYLHVGYSSKLPINTPSAGVIDDVEGKLRDFIPGDYSTSLPEFLEQVESDALSFRPYGEKIYSYSRPASSLNTEKENGNGRNVVGITQVLSPEDEETVEFEVYHVSCFRFSTWATPGFREYHRRMQLFILLYIEGGSYINEEEDVWEFVVLYEKRKRRHSPEISTYHFIGYSTLYPFYCFPEKHRMRLSQFVILPPYQQEGHGSALYTSIYQYILSKPMLAELTVEDPAEAFEDLRDRNDLKMLLSNQEFMKEAFGDGGSNGGGKVAKVKTRTRPAGSGAKGGKGGKLGPPSDKAWMEKWRIGLKIASRQFNRLMEMLIQRSLDPSDTSGWKAYRLQVKERLYRFNFEVLMQLDKPERQQKLEETFQSVKDDYDRILGMIH
ncbi:histone acetyltransferase type B catalytic subunit [Abortiporus biennis]|nr:histone acetyltransferase type B catalytic subunit [Abortiporus biennis]